jgi:hypothetical protein
LIQIRAGGHENIPTRPVDVSAFSFKKKTTKPEPKQFVKRGTGNGGMLVPHSPKSSPTNAEVKKSKLLTYSAYCPRPNPPNTELRRYSSFINQK